MYRNFILTMSNMLRNSGGHDMKRQWLKRAILSMVACGSLAGFIPGVQAADVRILPVDNAKFLAGAKFDFDVEVSKAKNLKNVDITVNGQKADKFFGQELKGKDLGNGVISYRANQVNFPKTGSYTVKATAPMLTALTPPMPAIPSSRKKPSARPRTSSSSSATACPCKPAKWPASFPKA